MIASKLNTIYKIMTLMSRIITPSYEIHGRYNFEENGMLVS